MAKEFNLGRIQGGGFFGSTSTGESSIPVSSVIESGIRPLVGDTIVNANGSLCKISAIDSAVYSTVKYGQLASTTDKITYREGR